MPRLDQELEQVQQRTGSNTGKLRTDSERAAFSVNVRTDLASIINQLNNVYKPLVEVLASEDTLNALDFGLSGNVIFTHINATAASAEAFYDATLSRARTIKETIDVLITEIARLETEISRGVDVDPYDDTEVRGLISKNDLNLQQLKLDSMGENYTFDNDGLANLTYPLSQAIDAMGAFFAGYPGTGNTYTASYPALSLTILLSQVTLDTTIPQSTITGLPADLGYIRTFIGMDTSGPETPTYSAHGPITTLSDGQSLEEGMQALDAALGGVSTATLQSAFDNGNTINMPNGTGAGVEITSNDTTQNEAVEITQNVSKAAMRIATLSGNHQEPAIDISMDSVGSRAFRANSTSTDYLVTLADTRTTGTADTGVSSAGAFLRNRPAAQTDDAVVFIYQSNATDDQPALRVKQDASSVNAGLFEGDVEIQGKLTVTGLIDPTGLVVDYQATNPAGTIASKGTFWGRSDDTPIWTDGSGVDHVLNLGAAHASDHILGGGDEIDGDQLDIDFTPTFYTPTTAPAEASDLDHLTAHLAGIDVAIGAAGGSGGETLAQTLALGDTTGANDIFLTSPQALAGADAGVASGLAGDFVRLRAGDGDGVGDGGDILFSLGTKGGSGTRDGYFGINTVAPSHLMHLDTSTGGEGAAFGSAFIGNLQGLPTTFVISHESKATSATDWSMASSAAGATRLNAATGQAIKMQIAGTTDICDFNANGVVVHKAAADTTGENAAIMYNTTSDRFRVYEDSAWYNMHSFRTASNITSNSAEDVTADDFVFGAVALDSPTEKIRFQFDKSKGAFRAGRAALTEWNGATVGTYSVAFGENNTASGESSSVLGGQANSIDSSSPQSVIAGGGATATPNTIVSSTAAFVGAGISNDVSGSGGFIGAGSGGTVSAARGGVVAGQTNTVSAADSFIGAGSTNTVSNSTSGIGAGTSNSIDTVNSFVGAGQLNNASGTRSFIGAGSTNVVQPNNSAVVAGNNNLISAGVSAAVVAGASNIVTSGANAVIVGGSTNQVVAGDSSFIGSGALNSLGTTTAATNSGVVAGSNHDLDGASSGIVAGDSHNVDAVRAFVGAGFTNTLSADSSGIVAGDNNTASTGTKNFIGAGDTNSVTGTSATVVAGSNNSVATTNSAVVAGNNNSVTATAGTKNFIGGGESNTIQTAGSESAIIGGGESNKIDVVVGSATLGERRTSEGAGTDPMRNRHVIGGGFTNLIQATLANGGELGFIGGGAYNQIDDTNGDFHGHVITGGFNNLIQATKHSFIGTGYENKIYKTGASTPTYGVILTGDDNIIDGATGATILNGTGNTITEDYATMIGCNDKTADSYGTIMHGATSQSSVIKGLLRGAVGGSTGTNYLLVLNDPGAAITTLGTNKAIQADTLDVWAFYAEISGFVNGPAGADKYLSAQMHATGYYSGSWQWITPPLSVKTDHTVAAPAYASTTTRIVSHSAHMDEFLAAGNILEFANNGTKIYARVNLDVSSAWDGDGFVTVNFRAVRSDKA